MDAIFSFMINFVHKGHSIPFVSPGIFCLAGNVVIILNMTSLLPNEI